MTRHLRGAAMCANGLEVRLDDTDAAVLRAVSSRLLRVEVLETVLAKALAALEAAPDEDTADLALRDEGARLEAEVARLADGIARGGDLLALVAAPQTREERRAHVQASRFSPLTPNSTDAAPDLWSSEPKVDGWTRTPFSNLLYQ